MKVLLIHSPYMKAFGPYDKVGPISFPMGLGYIAAVLLEDGFKVSLLDPENARIDFEGIRKRIKEEAPDIVGISCVTPSFSNAREIAKIVKEELSCLIVLGGVHASALPEETLKNYPEFDIVAIGEGEYTMRELCRTFKAGKKELDDIKGIAFRKNGEIIKTPSREWIIDLDSLPLPARHLVNMDGYKIQPHMNIGKKTATMITSRGCPFSCIFCSAHINMGRGYRPHSPGRVIAEIEHLKQNYGIEHIYFHDDTITVQKERIVEICNLLLAKKIDISWICMARVNSLSEDLVALMKKAGCYGIGFGVESGDETVLANIKKGITLQQCREAYRYCKKFGIRTYATFMFGNPGETKESAEKTIKFALELDPDIAMFYVLTPFPGSEVFNTYNKKLFQVSQDFDSYNILVSDSSHALYSYEFGQEDLKYYVSKANRQFYLRPIYLLKRLFLQRSWKEMKANIDGFRGMVTQVIQTKRKASVRES